MQKVLKIIFKSTASTDYIYPYYYVKNLEKKYKVDFLAWDFSPNHLKKNLPQQKFIRYNLYTIYNFLKINLKTEKFDNKFYLKRFYHKFLNSFPLLIKKQKIKNFLLGYDKIYVDCRELNSLPYVKTFCKILCSLNKEIIFVPHSPYYTNLIRETSDGHAIYFKKCKKKLFACTKKSKPWLDTGGFKKKECEFIGLPTRQKKWRSFISQHNKKGYQKTAGFLFRPFDRNFNKIFLKFRRGDQYINSHDENVNFITIAKKLNSIGYRIMFRLHPSSKEDAFQKFYKDHLHKLKYKFSRNTIHDFFTQNSYIISFNCSGLVYGCQYNKKIFLIKNKLINDIWKEWPLIKKIFVNFSNIFESNEDFFKKFEDKKSHKKYDVDKVLNLLW